MNFVEGASELAHEEQFGNHALRGPYGGSASFFQSQSTSGTGETMLVTELGTSSVRNPDNTIGGDERGFTSGFADDNRAF
jgi:hypothetical protein